MTRELHVYDHYGGMIAILFVDPDGAVEAFDIKGLTRMGHFGSVVEAAACACADAEMTSPGFLTRAFSIGDSSVARACAEVQKKFWDPPTLERAAGQSKWR